MSFFAHFCICVNSQPEAIKEIAEDETPDTEMKGPSKRLVKVVSNSTQTEDQKKSSSMPTEEEEKEVETRETQVSIFLIIFHVKLKVFIIKAKMCHAVEHFESI